MHVVIKGCKSISEYKEKKSRLSEQAELAYKSHKEKFENWNNGVPVKVWEDSNQYLCVEYESGKWWHYKNVGMNSFEWWQGGY